MVHHMLACVSESALEETLQSLRDKNPGDTDAQIFKRAVKKLSPPSVPCTPGYYRRILQDLLTYTANCGMPHLFVTATADEVSEIRWCCIDDLEQFINQKILQGLTWQDVPIECARLFHDRFTNLMHDHILLEDGSGIFGRVRAHMARYESQGRGSLHVHMLLWLHADDVERVCDEITASLPFNPFTSMATSSAGM